MNRKEAIIKKCPYCEKETLKSTFTPYYGWDYYCTNCYSYGDGERGLRGANINYLSLNRGLYNIVKIYGKSYKNYLDIRFIKIEDKYWDYENPPSYYIELAGLYEGDVQMDLEYYLDKCTDISHLEEDELKKFNSKKKYLQGLYVELTDELEDKITDEYAEYVGWEY